ncbi:phage tail protein [Oxalobacteraceae bacterium]|nr:phage tail protein [Oxalobacteraceae bacterium]
MSEAFLGEIRMFAFNFPPKGWARCDGQLLSINQNAALFAILGTSYGGNGQTTFALPDLRGRVPHHLGNGNPYPGTKAGEARHTLTQAEMPSHSHHLNAQTAVAGHVASPAGATLASVPAGALNMFRPADGSASLAAASVSTVGTGQSHENMQPYATSLFGIALRGIFPSRN